MPSPYPVLRLTAAAATVWLSLLAGLARAGSVTVTSEPPLTGTFFNNLSNNFASGGSENTFVADAQPFTTPDSTSVQLTSFSIYYVPNPGFPTNTLEAAVVEWNPANASTSGTPLWTSSPGTTTATTTAFSGTWGNWVDYSFQTTNLVLDPTKVYALIAFQNATANPGDSEPGLVAVSDVGTTFLGAYSIALSSNPGWAGLASSAWNSSVNPITYSTTFTNTTAVPEPASCVELAGLAALGLAWRWRRSSRQA